MDIDGLLWHEIAFGAFFLIISLHYSLKVKTGKLIRQTKGQDMSVTGSKENTSGVMKQLFWNRKTKFVLVITKNTLQL